MLLGSALVFIAYQGKTSGLGRVTRGGRPHVACQGLALWSRGVPLNQALAAADWPYPVAYLEAAVQRGYEQLPRSQKRLPLI